MKPAFALGLRGRLIVLLLAAFAILAGLVAWDFVSHRNERINAATAELLGHTRLIAARRQSISARADAILNGLMLSPELRPGTSAEACSQALAARLRQEVEFLQIGKVLPDGDVACAAVPPKGRVNVADRPWFQQALRTREMAVSDLLKGRIHGKTVVTFGKAVRDDAEQISAVLYMDLDLTWLQRELAKARLPEGARLAVIDSQGTVTLRHPDPEEWTGKNVAQIPLVQRILAEGGQGTLDQTGLDGKRQLFAYTPLLESASGSKYYLWLAVPKQAVESPALREALLSLCIMLAALIGTLGLVVWGGNRLLLQPLLTLSRVAARLGAGDLGARTGLPHSDNEIGRLARTLDETADSIEDRERKLVRANRALRVLSAGNRAMLRTKGEQELAMEMCRAIVEAGGYRIAWVGYAEHDPTRSVRTVAAWGAEREFLDRLEITWSETESGRGPTSTAIHLGIPVASNDIAAGPDYAPWRELARRHGFAASVSLPLRLDGAVIGALCICAEEPGAFDEEVVGLLSEAADDLAFGIATQRAEIEHGRTRAALQTAEDRFRAAAEASLDAQFILKSVRGQRGEILDFEFTDLNTRAEQMLDMTRGQVIGHKLCELIPISRTGGFFEKYAAVVTTGTLLEEEFPIDTPEIKAKWLRHQVVRVGDGIAISWRDITVWKEAAAAVRRLREQNTLILNSAAEGLIGLDTEGRATFINPAGAAMLRWTPEELTGQSMHALHHHSRADGTPYPPEECPIYAAYRDGAVHDVTDEVFWRRDGTNFPVEYVSTPVRDEKGGLVGAVVCFNDITERKRAEETLAASEKKFRDLVETVSDWVWEVDDKGAYTYCSPRVWDLLGYEPPELIGKSPFDLMPAAEAARVAAVFGALLAERKPLVALENVNLHKDGREVVLEANGLPVFDSHGIFKGYRGIDRDITERKKVEAQLRETRDYLGNLFDHANAPIITWDPSFRITMFNHAFERLTGRDAGEIIGKEIDVLFPPERRDEALAHIRRTKGGERWETVEIPILHSSGEVRTALWNSATLYSADGKNMLATIAQGQDITERILAEQAIAESAERFRNATETVRDAFVIIQGEGGIVTVWNPAAEAIFGYTKEETIGQGIHEFLPPSRFREAARRGMEHFAKTGGGAAIGKTLELVALRKDGTEIPIELSLSVMQIHGKWFATGIARDITERKAAEKALARSNRALRTLSAGNEALVRATSEEELLQSVTRIIVEQGGYHMARVSYAGDDPEKTLRRVAWAGTGEDFHRAEVHLTWGDTNRGQVPIARAIRSGMPVICHDIAGDPGFAPWKDVALAQGYASNIGLPLSDGSRIFGGLSIYSSEKDAFDEEEAKLLAQLGNDLAYGIVTLRTRAERDRITYAHAHHAEILQKSLEQSIQAIADTVEARDPYTAGHQRRVGELAVAIAREMGLPEEKIHGIRLAAAIHDLGKIHVPAEILAKPGKLTDIEFMLIKTHPQAGYDILKDVDFPWPIADIVRQHHEKLDGSGYPQGLKDGQILLESRIMTVADVVEAMASHRPYRPTLGIDVALKEVEDGRGSVYDPAVADACLKLFREERFAFQA